MTTVKQEDMRTYLTFTLDKEDFAVDVRHVREVLDHTTITRVPRTPDFMKGVINLRGSVVPVVDMRLKFGMNEVETTLETCIIVLEVDLGGELTIVGALADSVQEVFEMNPENIEPPPRIGIGMSTEFISGMGKQGDQFIIILDINAVFSMDELHILRETEQIISPTEMKEAVRDHDYADDKDQAAVSETGEDILLKDSRNARHP